MRCNMIGGVWGLTEREWQTLVALVMFSSVATQCYYMVFYYLLNWKHTLTGFVVHMMIGALSGMVLYALLLGSDTIKHWYILPLAFWMSVGTSSMLILFKVSRRLDR